MTASTNHAMMKAVHQAGWGGREQLSVRDVPRPVPDVGSVLVRVMAVSIHAGDHHVLTGRPYLIRLMGRHEVPGMDFAGVIETVRAPPPSRMARKTRPSSRRATTFSARRT